jgi:hypothetical protein
MHAQRRTDGQDEVKRRFPRLCERAWEAAVTVRHVCPSALWNNWAPTGKRCSWNSASGIFMKFPRQTAILVQIGPKNTKKISTVSVHTLNVVLELLIIVKYREGKRPMKWRHSWVGFVTRLRAGWSRIQIPGEARNFFLLQNAPDGLRGPPSLLVNKHTSRCSHPEVRRLALNQDNSPRSNAQVKNVRSCTSTPLQAFIARAWTTLKILIEEFSVDLGSCLRGRNPTVPCL